MRGWWKTCVLVLMILCALTRGKVLETMHRTAYFWERRLDLVLSLYWKVNFSELNIHIFSFFRAENTNISEFCMWMCDRANSPPFRKSVFTLNWWDWFIHLADCRRGWWSLFLNVSPCGFRWYAPKSYGHQLNPGTRFNRSNLRTVQHHLAQLANVKCHKLVTQF